MKSYILFNAIASAVGLLLTWIGITVYIHIIQSLR